MTKTKVSKIFTCAAIGLALVFCGLLCGCQQSNYKPTLKASTIDSSALIKAGTLTVGVDVSAAPMATKASKIQGIDVDVASAIADELGLKVEIVDIGSSASTSLSGKKVDMVMGMKSNATTNDMWFSPEYLQTGSALFSMKSGAALPVKGDSNTFQGQMGSSATLMAQNQFGDTAVKVKTDLSSCFDDLAANKVNFVAADAVIGTYTSHINNNGAKLVGMLQKPTGYCIATTNENKVLQTSISTAIETLKSRGTLDVIANKWLASSINLDNVPKTQGADNEASSSELNNGVYGETSNTAKQN